MAGLAHDRLRRFRSDLRPRLFTDGGARGRLRALEALLRPVLPFHWGVAFDLGHARQKRAIALVRARLRRMEDRSRALLPRR